MAYRRIDDNDTVEIRRAQGGNKPETRTVAELNEYFSKEENTEIDTLQAQVGDYDPDTTRSTITGDLERLQADVLTAGTGLLDRTAALEAIVQTAASGAPVAPVAATASLAIGEGISLDFTARTAGVVGNDISVTLIDPGEDTDLGVTIEESITSTFTKDTGIIVMLGYAEGAVTSSLAKIKTAIETTPEAHALVAVSVTGSDATLAIAVDNTNLADGEDGTTGVAGALLYDATGIYVSVGESTTAVSNWKSITFNNE